DIGGAVGFERPDFHFAEALAAELRLAAQRLLGDERVGADRAGVDLVIHEVAQLEHVDVADRDRLLEELAGDAVAQHRLAALGQARLAQQALDLGLAGAIEDGRGEGQPQRPPRPAQVGFENLAHVHAAGHAQGVEHNLDRGAVGQVGHVLFRQDAGNDALVPVPAGHLVADGKLALHGDVDLDHLDHARRELVALGELLSLVAANVLDGLDLARGHLLDFVNLLVDARVLVGEARALEVAGRQLLDRGPIQLAPLGEELLVGLLVVQVLGEDLAAKNGEQALRALVVEDADFVVAVLFEPILLLGLDGLRAGVLVGALAGEDLDPDDRALDAGRGVEGGVAHIAGLLAEDGAQQLLLRGELGLALGRDLAHQDVARLHLGPDGDDAALVEVLQERLADVGDVAGDFLGPELGVARFQLELLDVDRGVVILLDQLLADQDGVLEVVPAPGHERDQDVAPEGELAAVGAGAVGQHLPLADPLAALDHRLLVDAGVLVAALEFGQAVDVAAHLARELPGMGVALHAHDDALGVHRIHDAAALGQHG